MTDRPILFSGVMVRALLAGRKTQTRRVITPQPANSDKFLGFIGIGETRAVFGSSGYPRSEPETVKIPISVGDRLWVREAWFAARSLDTTPPRDISHDADIEYDATKRSYAEIGLTGKPRPSMFMPRWASRVTLIVKDVKIERLQDISDADAIAEGIDRVENNYGNGPAYCDYQLGKRWDTAEWYRSPVDSYHSLWDSINSKGAWDENPWVVAYTFVTINANVDKVAA